jgi:hypothetical protein
MLKVVPPAPAKSCERAAVSAERWIGDDAHVALVEEATRVIVLCSMSRCSPARGWRYQPSCHK